MVVVPTSPDAVRRVAEAFTRSPERPGLFEELSVVLQHVVQFDAVAWFATDPLTLLPTAPAHCQGLPPDCWSAYWNAEFNDQDVLLFQDLARSTTTADSLWHATDGNPERSPRYRARLVGAGFGDELRAVFRAGTAVWGVVNLFRRTSGAHFTTAECAVLQAVGPAIAAALRARVVMPEVVPDSGMTGVPGGSASAGAGVGTALFTHEGRLVSLDADAASWFRGFAGRDWNAPLQAQAMVAVTAVVARANAVGNGRARGASISRVRTDGGRWTVLSASPSRTPGGDLGLTSLVVERARPSQTAALLIEAFCLTSREREIVQAIAHGCSNDEIGRRLNLSAHTVRDHLTSIFDKVHVSTRGELAAHLFAEGGGSFVA